MSTDWTDFDDDDSIEITRKAAFVATPRWPVSAKLVGMKNNGLDKPERIKISFGIDASLFDKIKVSVGVEGHDSISVSYNIANRVIIFRKLEKGIGFRATPNNIGRHTNGPDTSRAMFRIPAPLDIVTRRAEPFECAHAVKNDALMVKLPSEWWQVPALPLLPKETVNIPREEKPEPKQEPNTSADKPEAKPKEATLSDLKVKKRIPDHAEEVELVYENGESLLATYDDCCKLKEILAMREPYDRSYVVHLFASNPRKIELEDYHCMDDWFKSMLKPLEKFGVRVNTSNASITGKRERLIREVKRAIQFLEES